MKTNKLVGAFVFCLLMSNHPASAVSIDFDSEGYTGPSLFASAPRDLHTITIGDATFKGGVVLTDVTNLSTNNTSVYGTASFVPGMNRTLEIDFAVPIKNISFNLYNGWTSDKNYIVYDNMGHSSSFNLHSNANNGQSLVEFAAEGSKVFIECTSLAWNQWDFLIDNIQYDKEMPSSVPEPATLLLLGAGLAGIGLLKRKTRTN